MSLALELGTKPEGLEIKTFGVRPEVVFLGAYEISMADFLFAAHYVLTNSDLEPNDLRPQFLKCVNSMHEVKGYNPGGKRLEASEPVVLRELLPLKPG